MKALESSPAETIERPILVHSALITAQLCFGLGGIISALGLPACNPFAFALYREIAAGTLLGVAAAATCRGSRTTTPQAKQSVISINWPRFTLLGLTLFGNQACVIAGIKLAGPVAAAVSKIFSFSLDHRGAQLLLARTQVFVLTYHPAHRD